MNPFHTPVLVREVMEGLRVTPGKRYIDATIGGGGHGWEIVKRGGELLGIDVDREALEFTKQRFEVGSEKLERKGKWILVQGNFRNIETIAKENGFEKVDGVLFDLGVSSHQLDTVHRGFSWRSGEAPLDLRMNQEQGVRAAEIIGTASEEELYEIFAKFGEEELAGPIAHAVVGARRVKPIETTGALAAIIETVVPTGLFNNSLSRVFQAIRIAVNDELVALREGLAGAVHVLAPGGRLAVISFHSLEDRIVKGFLKQSNMNIMPNCPIRPTRKEIENNRRARSAKLRIAANL